MAYAQCSCGGPLLARGPQGQAGIRVATFGRLWLDRFSRTTMSWPLSSGTRKYSLSFFQSPNYPRTSGFSVSSKRTVMGWTAPRAASACQDGRCRNSI
jgi:hypothetical protein